MTDGKGKFWMTTTPEYCRKSLEDSLERMGVDYVDLYIMRSVDGKTPIEESVKAMAVSLPAATPTALCTHAEVTNCDSPHAARHIPYAR